MTKPQAGASRYRLRLRALAATVLLGALTACVQPPRLPPGDATPHYWSGRLALQVEDAASQSFSAGFELQGQPERGQLTLLNPLGNVMASLEWTPERAVLISGQQRRESPSLDVLVQELLGSPVPVAALFDWLQGNNSAAAGWQVDLSTYGDGRLVAQRVAPPPQATLRVAFSR